MNEFAKWFSIVHKEMMALYFKKNNGTIGGLESMDAQVYYLPTILEKVVWKMQNLLVVLIFMIHFLLKVQDVMHAR